MIRSLEKHRTCLNKPGTHLRWSKFDPAWNSYLIIEVSLSPSSVTSRFYWMNVSQRPRSPGPRSNIPISPTPPHTTSISTFFVLCHILLLFIQRACLIFICSKPRWVSDWKTILTSRFDSSLLLLLCSWYISTKWSFTPGPYDILLFWFRRRGLSSTRKPLDWRTRHSTALSYSSPHRVINNGLHPIGHQTIVACEQCEHEH